MRILPIDLFAIWRKRADDLREYSDANCARLWNIAATELQRALESLAEESREERPQA